ncbi:conserved hypothetical protein [Trichinella spiralis]|uniref:hypothetical protein n=1 Tax=Trichinella spiralis TaxID=6334 RepID=UPI0001EFE0A5|nr:conserved hypothetical protein [Trichinella spiralis]
MVGEALKISIVKLTGVWGSPEKEKLFFQRRQESECEMTFSTLENRSNPYNIESIRPVNSCWWNHELSRQNPCDLHELSSSGRLFEPLAERTRQSWNHNACPLSPYSEG